MVAPLVGGVVAAGVRYMITTQGLREAAKQFATSLPFGVGYSLGTYLGFPKNYSQQSSYQSQPVRYLMPYPQRKIRVWSRRYRKYVWVYPRKRRSYGYNRYGRY